MSETVKPAQHTDDSAISKQATDDHRSPKSEKGKSANNTGVPQDKISKEKNKQGKLNGQHEDRDNSNTGSRS